jgi:hypothetical protein
MMKEEMQIVRLLNTDQPSVDWAFALDSSSTDGGDYEFAKLQDPTFLFAVPGDDAGIYMAGRFIGSGAVMRFTKDTGEIDWFVHLAKMTDVRGFTPMSDGVFAVCGDYYGEYIPYDLDDTKYEPVIA